MNFESTKKYKNLVRYLRIVAKILGLDMFDPNYKVNYRTVFVAAIPISLSLSYFLMLFQPQTEIFIFEGLIMNLLVVQGTTKLLMVVINQKDYRNIIHMLDHVYEKHEKLKENQGSLNTCIDGCFLIYKFLGVCYTSVFVFYCLLPVIQYYFNNIIVTIYPVHLPFLDPTSTLGYIVNLCHQVIFILTGVTGVLTFDVGFIVYLIHFIPFVNLLRIRLHELDVGCKAEVQAINEIRQNICNAIVEHQKSIRYIGSLNKTFSTVAGVHVSTSALLLAMAIFLFLWKKWFVAPFLGLVTFCQLAEFCIVGTVVQIQNEKMVDMIYNISWYLLPARDQKTILFMLMQKPQDLVAGKMTKLNVETLMAVLKTIYSFTMMVMEFLSGP